jgi:multidrug efflux pump subunit AcrA (membrane-fusion protein)
VFTVSDLSTLWAVLDAREKDLPVINRSSRVAIRSQAYPGRLFEARGIRVADVVDEQLRTIKIRVEVANPDLALKSNMFVEGLVESDQATSGRLAVPEGAIQTFEGETAVFVRDGPDRFALRPVVFGESAGPNRVITAGLDGTETVVVAGAFALKSELMKSTLGGE